MSEEMSMEEKENTQGLRYINTWKEFPYMDVHVDSVQFTPAYEDSCGHPSGSFVGSVTYVIPTGLHETAGKYPIRTLRPTVDVYVFGERGLSQQVCIRTGSGCSDYHSAGTVLDVLIKGSQQNILPAYSAAAKLIDSSFRIRAERREKGFWRENMDCWEDLDDELD